MMRRGVVDVLGRYPLLPVAIKTAVAAALAWLVVRPIDGPASDYSYYAPLGAVVVVSSRLAASIRWSLEAVLAVALGAALALGAREVPVPGVVGVGLVVGAGTLIGAWRRVGSMASWVPISALFILILGGQDPFGYVLAYLGYLAAGAAVGVVVNVLVPPLPMIATHTVQESLREVLATQLVGLADGLERDPLPSPDEWHRGESVLIASTRRAEELLSQMQESAPINWRVRRHRDAAARQISQGRALSQLTFLVQEMIALLAQQEHSDRSLKALGPQLRPPAAKAFRSAAQALRSTEASSASQDELARAGADVDAFARAISEHEGDGEVFAAGSLVTAIRRVLASITPDEQ